MSDPRPPLPSDRPIPDRAIGATTADPTQVAPATLRMLATDDTVLCVDDTCVPLRDEA